MGFYERLQKAGFANYDGYLTSPRWAAFRKSYREAKLPTTCAVCGGRPVQLHHHTYERLCDERLSDVTPLCRKDHVQVHACLKTFGWSVLETAKAIEKIKAGERFDARLVTDPASVKTAPAGKKKKRRKTKKEKRRQREENARRRQAAAILAKGVTRPSGPPPPPYNTPEAKWLRRVREFETMKRKVRVLPSVIPAGYVPHRSDPGRLKAYLAALTRQRIEENHAGGPVAEKDPDDAEAMLRALAAGIRPRRRPGQ